MEWLLLNIMNEAWCKVGDGQSVVILHTDALCLVWWKLAQCFSKRRRKCEKITTSITTMVMKKDNGQIWSENITLTLDSGELNVLWMPIIINYLFYCLAVCIQWVYFIYVLHSIFLSTLGYIQYHIYHCCCYNLRMCCYKSPNRRHQRNQKDILKVKKKN